jgi:hypothetical protein
MPGQSKEKDEIIIPDEEKMIVPEGYTEEEWLGLSEGERTAIQSKEEDDEKEELTEAQLKSIAEEPPKEEPPKEEPPKEEPPKEEPPKEEPPKERISDETLLSFRPTIDETTLPIPGEEFITDEIQVQLDELEKKYTDEELPLKDYMSQRDVLNRRISSENNAAYQLTREQARADLTWKAEQTAFFRARPEYEYAKDGSLKGKLLYGALNQAVKDIDLNPEYTGLSGVALLVRADKMVKEAFGLNKLPEIKKEEKKEDKKAELKPPVQVPDLKTLADIPAAQMPETDSPWNALDKLSGDAFESALERLTPAQRDRYLASK